MSRYKTKIPNGWRSFPEKIGEFIIELGQTRKRVNRVIYKVRTFHEGDLILARIKGRYHKVVKTDNGIYKASWKKSWGFPVDAVEVLENARKAD